MLFRNKKCTQCGSSYDVVEETCPTCHARDESFETLNIPKNMVWLPIYKQVLLFLLGFVVLNLISSLSIELIFKHFFEENSVTMILIVNYLRYTLTLGMMGVLLIHSYPKFKDSFIKWLPYVVGVIAGLIHIGFNISYNVIVGIFHEFGTNENQTMANALVKTYPVLAFFLLSFLGPVVEELTYRVGLFTFLTRVHKALAYSIVIILFGLIHFNFDATGSALIDELLSLPVYLVSGATLCILYDKLGLSCSLVAHIVNNITSTLPIIFTLLIGQGQ